MTTSMPLVSSVFLSKWGHWIGFTELLERFQEMSNVELLWKIWTALYVYAVIYSENEPKNTGNPLCLAIYTL